MEIQRVGVIGCGLMGSGIAEVVARAGIEVIVREVDPEAVERGRERIERSMQKALAKERATIDANERARSRLRFTTQLGELGGCDLIIEAIVEDADAKAHTFARLDEVCGERTVFTTNTSSLTVTDLAARTARPERFMGLHFFNPVPAMRLVEVVPTLATLPEVQESVLTFARALGKEPIVARDGSGFVVNLLLVPYMLDAIRQLDRGVASVVDIDTAMRLGCGHPMGPFTLCDFVGLDTTLRIAEIMFDEYRESRYAPPPLLRRLVALGRFGRKSGQGFYDYSGAEPRPLDAG